MNKKICIIVPVCNEMDNVCTLVKAIQLVMEPLPYVYSITFVDDGSNDGTLGRIRHLAILNKNVFFISFSRNFGHQNALKAGIDSCRGDCMISMDGDLQHPPALIPQMIRYWEQGHDIVYTIRQYGRAISGFKRRSSGMFYKAINQLSDIELESGSADFRLLDRKVTDVLREFKEYELFWRGLIKWMGFKQIAIAYEASVRTSGKSKYTFPKMVQFALHGITSFSTKPLSMAIYMGFACFLVSLLYIPYITISLYLGRAISGWASLLATVVFFGGVQLLILGIIGIYLGKLFIQAKQRPQYIIRETNLP
ncbi:MAG: glycosyltransferase family 2 protein [Chitinophagaceae bacterium]|nr:glycosyltransferase family 2 protein [Chitinophagaceae bacterium]